MNLYDYLMEMVIYEDSIEEYKNRRSLLEGYSKEDLQNPETVKKIYDEFEKNKNHNKYRSVADILMAICVILGIILAIPTVFVGTIILFKLCAEINMYCTNLPLRKRDKELSKIKAECLKLKDKYEKEYDKNKDQEIKKIIDQINKTLNTIEQEAKKENNKKELDKLNSDIEIIKDGIYDLEKFFKNPTTYSDRYSDILLYVMNIYNLKDKFIAKCKSNIKKFDLQYFDDILQGTAAEENLNLFGDNKHIEVRHICGYDNFLLYCEKENIFIYIIDGKDVYINEKAFSEINKQSNLISKKAYIEADKELGYYLLSKAPDGIKPKANPFK